VLNDVVAAPSALPAEVSPGAVIGAAAVVLVVLELGTGPGVALVFELGIGSGVVLEPVPTPPFALGSEPLVLAAGAFADAGATGVVGGKFAGALAVVGTAATASSRAAKGWAALAWLVAIA
jgi:hypothetical protein